MFRRSGDELIAIDGKRLRHSYDSGSNKAAISVTLNAANSKTSSMIIMKPSTRVISIGNDAQQFARAARGHWGIENTLHWSLDVTFREDDSRIRQGEAAENFALVRHLALSLLKQEKTAKVGIAAKRFKAALDTDYLLKVLTAR